MTYDLTEDGPSGAHVRRAYIAPFMDLVPEIDGTVFVAPTSAIVGAVRIDANSSVWHNVTIRGDNNYVTVGENTNIQDNTCIHIDSRSHPTIIGSDVTIGHSALVHACTIGDGGFVGMGAIIMDQVVVEDDVMIAAGALVTPGKRLRSKHLYAGTPAREVRALTDNEVSFLPYSAQGYVSLKQRYLG